MPCRVSRLNGFVARLVHGLDRGMTDIISDVPERRPVLVQEIARQVYPRSPPARPRRLPGSSASDQVSRYQGAVEVPPRRGQPSPSPPGPAARSWFPRRRPGPARSGCTTVP